jgi:hypothetical protein
MSLYRILPPVSLPREPLVLSFDPTIPSRDGDGLIQKVFEDEIARQVWLLVKPGHLTNEHFPRTCIAVADAIRGSKPRTPAELFYIVRHFQILSNAGDESSYYNFMSRLLEGVLGNSPVQYRVILPDTPEDLEYKKQEHRRGYDDFVDQREIRGHLMGPYGRGYTLASNGKPYEEEKNPR